MVIGPWLVSMVAFTSPAVEMFAVPGAFTGLSAGFCDGR